MLFTCHVRELLTVLIDLPFASWVLLISWLVYPNRVLLYMLQKQFCLGNVNILNLVIGYREFDEPLLVIMKFQQLDRANLMINVSITWGMVSGAFEGNKYSNLGNGVMFWMIVNFFLVWCHVFLLWLFCVMFFCFNIWWIKMFYNKGVYC